jgi:hypothetical protein
MALPGGGITFLFDPFEPCSMRMFPCVRAMHPLFVQTGGTPATRVDVRHSDLVPGRGEESGARFPMRRVRTVASTVWTQTASLRWAPELRFYENRAAILRAMEESGLLTAFRMGEDEAGAQIGDRSHEVEFSHRNLEVTVGGRDSDIDRVISAVTIVLEHLRPTNVARPSFTFQHVAPLTRDYDESRRKGLASLFGSTDLGSVVLSDFANLFDGVAAEPAATVSVEYGVVSRDELPRRLSRQQGRSARPARRHPPSLPQDFGELPAVALFVDATWSVVGPIDDDDAVDEFKQAWEACRHASEGLAEALRHHLFGPPSESDD